MSIRQFKSVTRALKTYVYLKKYPTVAFFVVVVDYCVILQYPKIERDLILTNISLLKTTKLKG